MKKLWNYRILSYNEYIYSNYNEENEFFNKHLN